MNPMTMGIMRAAHNNDVARDLATKLVMTCVEAVGANGKSPADMSGAMAIEIIAEMTLPTIKEQERPKNPIEWDNFESAFKPGGLIYTHFLRVWESVGGHP